MSDHKTESKASKEFKKLVNDLDIELLKESLKEFLHNMLYLLLMETMIK